MCSDHLDPLHLELAKTIVSPKPHRKLLRTIAFHRPPTLACGLSSASALFDGPQSNLDYAIFHITLI
jgi:hypothetical protein